ncbi:MAG: hypothetical protein ABMA25_26005 [Ilumatobacteraceae bacterium]
MTYLRIVERDYVDQPMWGDEGLIHAPPNDRSIPRSDAQIRKGIS